VPALLAALAFLFFAAATSEAGAQGPPEHSPPEAFARAHRSVTPDADAQAAFDDGLTLLYAFDPEEARRSFERAVRDEPLLGVGWWGVAMSYGVNINTAFDAAQQRRGRDAIVKATALAARAAPADRGLIEAASKRFAFVAPGDADRSARSYRDAMNAVATAFPGDDDVQALAAEAEMDAHSWSYFTADGKATPGTNDTIARVQTVLARDPEHLGANHFLIHLLEESPHPEGALASARRLAAMSFEPAAEHLAHMPAHTFMRVGDYHAAGQANARAVALYQTYLAGNPAGHGDYLGHDCRFGIDAFMMSGEAARAHPHAATCARSTSLTIPIVDTRFRRWSALAQDGDLGDFTGGMLLVHDGRLALAATHAKNVRKAADSTASILADILDAALARANGRQEAEIAALTDAVRVQDGFGYSEPPAFWYPVRESLAAAYYRAARYDDAERVFRADLARNAENPRSLYGLAQTLEREGRTADAQFVRDRFMQAWKFADVTLDINEL
jgi:tetratricopeptide (TPR) repeat protein